jgi:ribonucleotide reductase beta subunit family protein with ferritin-like domain
MDLDIKFKNNLTITNEKEKKEYLTNPENNRLTIYPLKNHTIWESYKKQLAAFWTAEEIDFSKDYSDFNKLNSNEKHFIKMVLAFFSASDTIVNINLSERFTKDVKVREAIVAYNFQMMMENIHCVHEDTMILTDNGYFKIYDLLDCQVKVWNGEKFSETTIKYTGDSKLYHVELSNGMSLKCTPNHKWFINDSKIKTCELKEGHIISNYVLPILDIPYTHSPINKASVPINYSYATKLLWLSNIIYKGSVIDGNIYISTNKFKDAYDVDKYFNDIQLLLTTMNIRSIVNKEYIIINIKDLPDKFDSLKKFKNDNNLFDQITVSKITKLDEIYKTYCFTEKERHAGIFNGILTGQSETYSLQIDNIVRDPEEKNELFDAIRKFPCIAKKAEWQLKWIESDKPFSYRLIAFAIVEGVFFSGSFCSIFWLKQRNIMPGLCASNELIARDEGMHTNFAILLYSMIQNRIAESEIHEMFIDAVNIEIEFICESLPCAMLGINSDSMTVYIKYVADRLLIELGYNKIWNVQNPFDFMEKISMEGKTNFFEARPTQYQKSSVMNKTRESSFALTDDF